MTTRVFRRRAHARSEQNRVEPRAEGDERYLDAAAALADQASELQQTYVCSSFILT